jgi:hypothetical protein
MSKIRTKLLKIAAALVGVVAFCWFVNGISALDNPLFTSLGLLSAPILAWLAFKFVSRQLKPDDDQE